MKRVPLLVSGIVLALVLLGIAFLVYRRLAWRPRGALALRPGAMTEERYSALLLQFYLRVTVDAYIQAGAKSDAWNGDATRLLEGYAREEAGAPGALAPPAQAIQARAILREGCADPLILYVYARALCLQHRERAAVPYLYRAIRLFTAGRYPGVCRQAAPLRLAACLSKLASPKREEIASLHDLHEQWLATAMHDGSFLPGERRIALDLILRQGPLRDGGQPLLEKMAATPGDDRYLQEYLHGVSLLTRAEVAGGDVAGREACLREAYQALYAAWKARREYPEAPTALIVLARAHPALGGAPRAWFERAIAAQGDYRPAYDEMMTALLPRHGGSYIALYAFGQACLGTRRYDTIVPACYFDVLARISEDSRGSESYWNRPETLASLETMFAGYEARAPAKDQAHYKSLHAAVAWRYGRYSQAMQLLDELGDRVESEAFARVFHADFARVRAEIYRKAPPAGPLIARAEKTYRAKGAAVALGEYRRILAQDGWSPYLTELLADRCAQLAIEDGFAGGEWVNLFPGPGLAGWNPVSGNWSLDGEGALTGIPGDDGMLLLCRLRVPARLEMRVEIEFPPDAAARPLSAGLVLGGRDAAVHDGELTGSVAACQLDAHAGLLVLRRALRRGGASVEIPLRPRNLLRVSCANGQVAASLNGVPAGTLEAGALFSRTVLLGIYADAPAGLPLKFRRLQLRHPDGGPAAW